MSTIEKDLGITEVRGAKANISDLQVSGDGDTFALLCKASSQSQGWMKSTKVCNVEDGCIVQVTTQQKNPDGSYAVAEALSYVPGMQLDKESEPRRLVSVRTIARSLGDCDSPKVDVEEEAKWRKRHALEQSVHILLEAFKAGVHSVEPLLEKKVEELASLYTAE
jgi:hypothetical protein